MYLTFQETEKYLDTLSKNTANAGIVLFLRLFN